MTASQFKRRKKLLIVSVAALLFAGYIYWSDNTAKKVEDVSLAQNLAALESTQDTYVSSEKFNGTDTRGVSLGGGGGGQEEPAVFETVAPSVVGTFVGWGIKSDPNGEYLVAYVQVTETEGVEVDMRDITKYSLIRPTNIEIGDSVRVYGVVVGEYTIRARSIQ